MPLYVYRDSAGHTAEVAHRMLYSTAVVCVQCRAVMHRVPQVTRINWNGDTAAHAIHPTIKRLIDNAPANRERVAEMHAQHERDGVTDIGRFIEHA